jgi:hypothetical protein
LDEERRVFYGIFFLDSSFRFLFLLLKKGDGNRFLYAAQESFVDVGKQTCSVENL